jgi:carboxylesterase
MPQIIPTAEPFLFPGSRTGCLLIHGFTGSPKEMRWMGEYLAGKGYSVLGVRLSGHATRPEDMVRSRWTDWVASVEDGYHMLSALADHIYLVGLSMGGVLSLLLSTRLKVKGVIGISTPMALPADWRLMYLGLLALIAPYQPKSKYPPGYGWFDKAAWKEQVSYPQNPVRSIIELNLLLAELRSALPDVRVPVLLAHSQDDGYIVPANMERLYSALTGTSDKTMLSVKGSGHVVTRDAARQEVFEAAGKFILRVESGAQ